MPFLTFLLIAGTVGVASVAAAGRLRDRTYAVTAAIAGGIVVFFVNAAIHVRVYHDDAYITLRYARNLANGVGPVWNSGERVEGYTNFLWMVILAGMHVVGMDLVVASILAAYASSFACLLVVWLLWSLWADDEDAGIIGNPALLAVTLLVIGLNGAVAAWAFGGLETPLAMALLTGAVYLFIVEQRTGRFPVSALVFTAGAMTRPELVGIVALTAVYGFGDAWFRRDRAALRRMAIWTALFAVIYVPYFAWRWWYYGYLLPNTFYVKVGGNQVTVERGLTYIFSFGNSYAFLPLAIGAIALAFDGARRLARDGAYIVAVIAMWLTMVALEGGDVFPHGRFLVPIVPLLSLAGVVGWARVMERALATPRQVATVSLAAAVLLGLTLAQSSVDADREGIRELHQRGRTVGEVLGERLPQDYTVGVFAAGATPYYSQLPTIDMLGLSDETIAHTDVENLGSGIIGHEKYNLDYVLDERRPEILIIGSFAAGPQTREEVQSSALAPALGVVGYQMLVEDPRLWERYQMSAFRVDALWYSFAQRKDTLEDFRADWTESDAGVGTP